MSITTSNQNELSRRLSLTSAIFIVVGSMIASGIFLTPQNVAASVQIPGIMIFVWILTGFLTLAGALTNAEIASIIPEAGGQYVFFRVTYNDLVAFLYGWTTFIVYQTGSISAIAVAFARYLGYFVDLPHLSPELEAWQLPFIGNIYPLKDIGVSLVAISAIILLAIVNYFGVHFGGFIVTLFTILKVIAIGAIITLSFSSGMGNVENFFPLWGVPSNGALVGAIGVAMIATLWSYDGWNSITYLAGEVKEPQKNIPRAIIIGTITVIIIYVLTNLAYLYILPIEKIATSKLVAADVMDTLYPSYGGAIISIMVMISTFGAVNATSLTTARVFFAMAKDKLFFKGIEKVHPKYKTPHVTTILTGCVAAVVAGLFPIGILGELVSIGTLLAFVIVCAGIIVLRKTNPDIKRPFKTPFVPLFPILGILICGLQMYALPTDTWLRLIIWMAIGVIIYFAYSIKHSKIRNQQ